MLEKTVIIKRESWVNAEKGAGSSDRSWLDHG